MRQNYLDRSQVELILDVRPQNVARSTKMYVFACFCGRHPTSIQLESDLVSRSKKIDSRDAEFVFMDNEV